MITWLNQDKMRLKKNRKNKWQPEQAWQKSLAEEPQSVKHNQSPNLRINQSNQAKVDLRT